MPIRLNLLAEAQAAEDMRRRDPVKRAIWVGAGIIVLMLGWSSSIQFKAALLKNQLKRVESQLTARTNEYQAVLAHEQKAAELHKKLDALKLLAANRLLNGTLLNALQQTTVQDVQLVRFGVDQTYVFSEEIKPRTVDGRSVPGKPASAAEKILLTLEATDSSPNPGDQVNKLKEAIACNGYFKDHLARTNPIILKSLSPQQLAPGSGLPSVLFSLQCRYPDQIR
jgi:hypothetical protein